MKIIIESHDVERVKANARHFHLALTDAQAKQVIRLDRSLQGELLEYGPDESGFDTHSRDILGDAICRFVFGKAKPKVANSYASTIFDWPHNGSPKEYRAYFFEEFVKQAKVKGLDLVERPRARKR
jgi:hypothetical protein